MKPRLVEILFWPPVTDSKWGNQAIKTGYYIVFFYAFVWAIISVLGLPIFFFETHSNSTIISSIEGLLHAIITGSLGVGLVKKSKIAAVIVLILACIGFLQNLLSEGFLSNNTFLFLYGTFSLIHTNRAIWAYQNNNEP